jgi:hypothetical protein
MLMPRPSAKWPVLLDAGVPFLLTTFLWATSSYQLSLVELLSAFVLCWIPWASAQHWYRGDRESLPLFALISAMYWLGFAVPLFWGGRTIDLVNGTHFLSRESIEQSVLLALIGMVALWIGMQLARKWKWTPQVRLDVPQDPWRWHYLRLVLVASSLMKIFVPLASLGENYRQIVVNIEVIVPAVAFTALLRRYLHGTALTIDKILLSAYFLVALVLGVSSGWLAGFIGLGLICIATYALERRRFPVTAILLVLPVILFFQPGKAQFRQRYWHGGPADTYADYGERINFWVDASARAWGNALSDTSGRGVRALAGSTLSRVSLLEQTANVIETTPRLVPYQQGRLYSYVLITWIPRFLWQDKPSMNEANRWYQVAYHISSPAQLQTVSIAVGTLTESYINFGWGGPILVMSCLGFFLGSVEKIFLRSHSGILLNSLGTALLPALLVLESQMAEYVAGIVQQILLAILILMPILEISNRNRRFRQKESGSYPQRVPLNLARPKF